MDDDNAFFEFLAAREAALQAAAGYFVTANVPSELLREIAETTTEKTISLAARIVLYQRGQSDSKP